MIFSATALKLAKRYLLRNGLEAIQLPILNAYRAEAALSLKTLSLRMMADDELRRTVDLLGESQSQLNQDFFVLHEMGWKRDGYFVEFGATDGKTLSNTWLLDRHFGWKGILAEPARESQRLLRAEDRNAALDFDCVWSRTGEQVTFNEAPWGELSTMEQFATSDSHDRQTASSYAVTTVSLNDLLDRHDAPAVIDYLSIDTEGSEFDILEAFDFKKRQFRCITCEHNFTDKRDLIRELLASHGYVRKFEEFSQFDDWYVKAG